LVLLVAYVLPLAWLLPISLRTEDGTGLGNFQNAPASPLYVAVAVRTIRIEILSGVACVVLAYPLAWVLGNLPRRWFRLIAVVVALPLLTSTIVRSEAWVFILLPDGVLNGVLGMLPGAPEVRLLHTEAGVLVAMIQVLLPI